MLNSKPLALYAFLFGLCVPLALAPFNFWPLMFVGIGGFFWLSMIAQSSKQAALFGWLYGVGYFGLGVSWVYGSMRTVDTSILLSVILTGGFCLLLAITLLFQMWFFHRFLKPLPYALLLIAPLWWVVNEWIREWFLTGMPWLFAGYGFTTLPTAQLGAVIGIYGLSLLMALLSAGFLYKEISANRHSKVHRSLMALMLVVVLIATFIYGTLVPASRWTQEEQTIIAAAVQSNVDQRTKWSNAQVNPTLDFFGKSIGGMSEADLVLWPEAAITRRVDQIPSFFSQLNAIGVRREQAIITGILTLEYDRFYNSMIGVGSADGEYRKQHLVPFGEYLPFDSILRGVIGFFDISLSSMYPAGSPQFPISFTHNGEPYFAAPIICYEAAYPDLVRKLARESDILTVVSNDAWFGDSIGPHQHLQMTQMRAIENGRPMVRSTQNGISALINADGKILQKSQQFVPAELVGELTMRSGLTPFQRYPSFTIPVLCLVIIGFFVIQKRTRKGV